MNQLWRPTEQDSPILSIPSLRYKPKNFKYIKILLNQMPITCLVDIGAACGCLSSNIHHFNDLKLIEEDAGLICANGEEVNSINLANIKV